MARALVIGGTGPTGPGVVRGLLARGYDVSVLHGGQHEVALPADVRHIHTDPHWPEGLRDGLGRARFDLVVAQYGRLAVTAEVLAGRTERLVAVGGAHGALAPADDPRWGALGRPALVGDTDEHPAVDAADGPLGGKMAAAERALLAAHRAGAFAATLLAYPVLYGPGQPAPHEWCIVRRILDGRRRIVVADGGIRLESRLYTENAVQALLLAVDRPEAVAGRTFVVTDQQVFTMRQRITFVASRLGADLELVDLPFELAGPCHPYWRHGPEHRLRSSTAIRQELGYADPVAAADALAGTVDWLVENPPAPGGPEEQRLGDPFDYPGEDELLARWDDHRRELGPTTAPFRPTHAYRHPRHPDEPWRRPARG